MEQYNDLKNKLYYFLIGLISLMALVFLPMLGSDTDFGFNFPTSTVGWLVYIITKLCVAIINILIFICFVKQAEINIQDDENYKNAKNLLITMSVKDYIPRAPKQFLNAQYRTKGITLVLTSITACVSLTNAILTFDLVSFMTYIFTVAMAIVFGIITMKNNETYWTTEFYQYALYKKNLEENKNDEQGTTTSDSEEMPELYVQSAEGSETVSN